MPSRKKIRLSPLSLPPSKYKAKKECQRNEPLEVRNQRLAEQRFRSALRRSLETSAERSARLEATRIAVARRRKAESMSAEANIQLFERLKRLVANSDLSLDLIQQLDENFDESAPETGIESDKEKTQRLERNRVRKAIKNNIEKQEARRVRLEKMRIYTALKRSQESEEERAQRLLKLRVRTRFHRMKLKYSNIETIKLEPTTVEESQNLSMN